MRTRHPEPEDEATVLPPGQRDRSGFWFPLGYEDPRTLVRRRVSRRGAARPRPREDRGGADGTAPS